MIQRCPQRRLIDGVKRETIARKEVTVSDISRERLKRIAKEPTPRRRDTAQKLVAAAAEIIAEVGMSGASVQQICARAGFTRGAFYSSYRDVDHLLVDLIEDRAALLDDVLARTVSPTVCKDHDRDREADALTQAALHIGLALPLERDFYLLHDELVLYGARHAHIGELMRSYDDRLEAGIASLIERVLSGTGYRLDVAPTRAASLVLAVCERFYRALLLRPARDEQATRERVVDFVTQAVPLVLTSVTTYRG